MAPAIAYAIPAMQLVCNLVMPGIPGLNSTDKGLDVNQSPPQILVPDIREDLNVTQSTLQFRNATLPDGYIAYPDIGVAYKVYDEDVTANEARRRCFEKGAQLALIDSVKKAEYVSRQNNNNSQLFMHVGIHRFEGEWVSVSNGAPVRSIPWGVGDPSGNGNCVAFYRTSKQLYNYECSSTVPKNYVCELPIR